MSYDISLVDPVSREELQLDTPHFMRGGTYAVGGTTNASLNITYNYADQFRKVFPEKGIRYKRERSHDLMSMIHHLGVSPRLREHGIRDDVCDQYFARVKTWVDANRPRIEEETRAVVKKSKRPRLMLRYKKVVDN